MITEKKRAIIILVSVCLIVNFVYTFYKLVKPHNLDEDEVIEELPQEEFIDTFLLSRAKDIAIRKHKIKHLKELIKEINEEQHINPVHKFKAAAFAKIVQTFNNSKRFNDIKLDNTVIVVQVHRSGYDFVEVLLNSMRRVVGISGSLLIFAHDYYSPRVFRLINKVQFARTMQMYYPYSTQLHPYMYPGDNIRFCPEWDNCYYANQRADAHQIQGKLFWWWSINEVFNRVEILKNYSGYIYFLDAESYLLTDFIVVAKKLERHLPVRCPDCQILSLALHPPQAEMYVQTNSTIVISVWGRSYYSNSGIAFNRSTWNEIKSLKEEFCNFNDCSWENSLLHVASKTRQKQLYMLSSGEPRIFLTNNCDVFGNASYCALNSTYQDILKFTHKISNGLFPYKFKLQFEDTSGMKAEKEISGGFDDARDRELCMFFSSEGKRLYY